MTIRSNSLAEFLAIARRRAGLSQAKVAEHLRYSTPQFISNWERGVSEPPVEAIKPLLQLYNLTKKEVIDRILEDRRRELERKI